MSQTPERQPRDRPQGGPDARGGLPDRGRPGRAGTSAESADPETRARRLEGLLMAPCCGANTLAEHESPAVDRMRREIRELLAAGRSEREILDRYVATLGPTILAVPPSRGFNLVVYLVPLLALIGGPLLLWRRLRRRDRAAPPEPAAPPLDVDPAYRERLERQLRT
jgi:cytochrome c-type biogenesis protein CcmH